MKYLICVSLFLILNIQWTSQAEEDFYKLLEIKRDATVKEIRKAFKVLALKLHPDKNKEDKRAEEKFIKITKAYEVLRDPVKRSRYDVHGTKEFENFKRPTYHSYTYYRDQFGIYDDDPLIMTLSRNDYEVNVLDDSQPWFVNFYSPHCHHCHELAPTWRQLAQELEGVVRFAAVNCEDDYPFCTSLSINSYPTLLYYEKESLINEGQEFYGKRNLESLKEFVMARIKANVRDIFLPEWNLLKNQSWVIFLCGQESANCPEAETQTKIAAALEGLIPVGIVREQSLCAEIFQNYTSNPVVLWYVESGKGTLSSIERSDFKNVVNKVLEQLPNPQTLNEKQFGEIRHKLRSDSSEPWLICFYMGTIRDLNSQLKRLPTLVTNINIGLVHCGRSAELCSALHVSRYPTWGVLKKGGAFEMHHGRDVLYEVAAFARDAPKSTNLHALSPADFYNLKKEGSPWLIDWYAPWCPPCRNLMPEFRKSSQKFRPEQIQFGTIDCTLHRELCSKEHISSYPTLQLLNASHVHKFHEMLSEKSISEFVEDHLNPTVIELDKDSFISLERKPKEELWVVDFYAPWCGPCQRLAAEWRKLAKSVSQFHEVKIAHIDCDSNGDICDSQNIKAYPTIRLYPLDSIGLSTVAIYNGNRDVVSMKRWILNFLPSNVEAFNEVEFKEQILSKKYLLPWLVDFYAPWCGHCVHFEPEFRSVARRLTGRVRSAKIDCEANRIFCGHKRVTAFPTVRLYLSPKEYHTIDSQDATEITRRVKQIVTEYNERTVHDEL